MEVRIDGELVGASCRVQDKGRCDELHQTRWISDADSKGEILRDVKERRRQTDHVKRKLVGLTRESGSDNLPCESTQSSARN